MKIQVDMFEVGLGAALLLQFDTPRGPVRVLADGGVTGYPADSVLKKLPEAVNAFGEADALHIDLMIGTHYDADHLDGLVPIINDPTITIGEAWLPPVANDTQAHPFGQAAPDHAMLARQLAGSDGGKVLAKYLAHKAELCERLEAIERGEDENSKPALLRGEVRNAREQVVRKAVFNTRGDVRVGPARRYFTDHLHDVAQRLGDGFSGSSHADDDIGEHEGWAGPEDPDWLWTQDLIFGRPLDISDAFKRRWYARPGLKTLEVPALALIRKGAAKDAITAMSLNAVVKALVARKVNIRPETIPDGQPRRFIWRAAMKRFIPSDREVTDGPELTLMGPSDALVAKHRDRLPIGSYASFVSKAVIPIKGITPSNQLSYVMRFSHADQAILVTGDAGCVDFKPEARTSPYHQPLLDCLADLDVVQIAHHGGANAHFYRCLIASDFKDQVRPAHLLLSHAVNDKHRPSKEFDAFVATIRRPNALKILFTSRPKAEKVCNFRDIIVDVTGGPASDRGDVRLIFSEGAPWEVTRHLVEIV